VAGAETPGLTVSGRSSSTADVAFHYFWCGILPRVSTVSASEKEEFNLNLE